MPKGKVIGQYRGQDIFEWIEFDPGIRHVYVGIANLDCSYPVDMTADDILLEPGILYRRFKGRRKALSKIPQSFPQEHY